MLLLPWLIAYTRREGLRQRDAAQEASEEAKLERASSACRHAGGAKVVARNLLAEPRSAGNEETWNTLVAKFPPEDHAAVSAAAVAVLASATDTEDENAPRGAPMMSTPPRCSSTSSTPGMPCRAPETTAKDLLIYNTLFTPTSEERSSERV